MDKNFQILGQAINLQNSILFLHFAEYLMLSKCSQIIQDYIYKRKKEKARDHQKSHEGEVTDESLR